MTRKAEEMYSEDEAAKRRDEVVRRMANTPPQPRVSHLPKGQRKKAAPDQSSQKPDARKD